MIPGSGLLEFQAKNREGTSRRIAEAMSMVEAEIEEHGFYPHNKGRVDRNELCRRAKVGLSTLKNKTHADTAAGVRSWLVRLKKKAPTARPAAEDAKRKRIAELVGKVDEIAQHYNRFKIEYDRILEENGRLAKENAALRRAVVELGGDGANVLALPAARGRS